MRLIMILLLLLIIIVIVIILIMMIMIIMIIWQARVLGRRPLPRRRRARRLPRVLAAPLCIYYIRL